MSKLVTDAELDAAIKGLATGAGAEIVDRFVAIHFAAPAQIVRMDPAVADALLSELDLARLTAAKLAVEVLAHRRNIKIYETAPPSKMRECSNCVHYAAVLSPDAQAAPEIQAIVKDAGACTVNPPTMQQRGVPPHVTNVSNFPLVHPLWRCGRWEKVTTISLKVPSE